MTAEVVAGRVVVTGDGGDILVDVAADFGELLC